MTKKNIIVGIVIAFLAVGIVGLVVLRTYPFGLSCNRAVERTQAERIWQENQNVVKDLESTYQASTGFSIRLDTVTCRNKAFLHIDYNTTETRLKIEELLKTTPLKDLPIEWQNV